MISIREAGSVTTWFVAFHRTCDWALFRWLQPGPYKHVSVFGYCEPAKTWLYMDRTMCGLWVQLLPDGVRSEAIIAALAPDADVLVFDALPFAWGKLRLRPLMVCTTVVCDLLGLRRGALFPSTLWRLLLEKGAKVVVYEGKPTHS
jgi:hypothetical protein